jgi:hypothetical protein
MAWQKLQIPPGLERWNTPYDTPDRWWDMDQVRWQSGSMCPIGGWQKHGTAPLDSPPRRFEVWRDNLANLMVLIGTDNRLYVDESGGFTDITPPGFTPPGTVSAGSGGYGTWGYNAELYGKPRLKPSPLYSPYGYWTMDQWGEDILLVANTDGRLFYYHYLPTTTTTTTQSGPPVLPSVVSTAPPGSNGVVVTTQRHAMLIAPQIGTDRQTGERNSIAWSSQEDYADWNFASTTNTAGWLMVKTRTPLLIGHNVREGVLVHSYTDVFLIQYVGQPYVYGGTDPISDTSLFNPMSIVTFGGKAVWPSRLGFQLYNGGAVTILDCPILNNIFADMDPVWGTFRIHGAHNGLFPEIWWFYPRKGSDGQANSQCDRYVIWNYVENWWGWGSLARSAMVAAGASQRPYMGGNDGWVYEHEVGWLDNGASRAGQAFVESGALGLGNGDTTVVVRQMQIATGTAANAVSVQAIGRYAPDGPEYRTNAFTPGANGYLDCRFQFRDTRLRFSNARDDAFAIGVVRMDVSPGSGR